MTIKNADVPAIPATGNGMTKREMMALTKRLSQIWRQLRDYGSRRGFEMDYKFLRSCAHYVGV